MSKVCESWEGNRPERSGLSDHPDGSCAGGLSFETVYGRYRETDAVEGAELLVNGKAARIHIHGNKISCGSDVHGRGL